MSKPPAEATRQLATTLTRLLRVWEDNDDPAFRESRLREMERLLHGSDLLAVIQQIPPGLTGYAFALPTVREKLLSNPASSLSWLQQNPSIASTQLVTFLHIWKTSNSSQMEQSILSLPAGEWREKVLEAASNNTLSTDPVAAVDFAARMSPSPAQARLLSMAVTAWSGADPTSAAQWTAQVSDPVLRQQLTSALINPAPAPASN